MVEGDWEVRDDIGAWDYRDLKVWQLAHQLTVAVCKLVQRFPSYEQFGLANQMRRSAISIPANIAEGNGRSTLRVRQQIMSV